MGKKTSWKPKSFKFANTLAYKFSWKIVLKPLQRYPSGFKPAFRIRIHLKMSRAAELCFEIKIPTVQCKYGTSVADPWHFGTDPFPVIHTSWIRIRNRMQIRILLFRQLPSRRQQQQKFLRFFAHYFLKVHLQHFSKIKRPKEVTKQ